MAGRKWARGWALGPEDDVEPEPIEEAEEEEEDDEDDRLPAGGAAHLDEVVDADGAHVDAQRRRRRQHHEAQRVAPQRQPFPARRRAQKLQNTEQKKKESTLFVSLEPSRFEATFLERRKRCFLYLTENVVLKSSK